MTIEYTIQELRRYENEINELIVKIGESYRDYERSKEYYSKSDRRYIESHFKDLKDISSKLRSDSEKLDKWDKYINEGL